MLPSFVLFPNFILIKIMPYFLPRIIYISFILFTWTVSHSSTNYQNRVDKARFLGNLLTDLKF